MKIKNIIVNSSTLLIRSIFINIITTLFIMGVIGSFSIGKTLNLIIYASTTIIFIIFVIIYKSTIKSEKLEYIKNHTFDYKMILSDEDFIELASTHLENTIEDLKDEKVQPIKNLKFSAILENKSVKTIALKNKDKLGKCIIQTMFIPLDKDNNTVVVNRLSENHGGYKDIIKEEKIAFPSFSPIPNRYKENFEIRSCYNREIPINKDFDKDLEFKEMITLVRYTEKYKSFYLFFVYIVKYENVVFSKENIDKIFSVNVSGVKKYFLKDHDDIIGTKNIFSFDEKSMEKIKPVEREALKNIRFKLKNNQKQHNK